MSRDCSLSKPSSALPPRGTLYANPKVISERTSYYQNRLAFHSNPQVIRSNCTNNRFGPPPVFRQDSPCSWVALLASGLILYLYVRPYQTRFRCASGGMPLRRRYNINSLAHSSIGTPSRMQAPSSTPCKYMVSGLFHRPHRATFHLSLTVLVHYRSSMIFSLTG